MANDVRLEVDRLDSPVGRELVEGVLGEYVERYGFGDEEDGLSAEQLAPPTGVFLVAWIDDRAVGCGGFRRIDDDVAELKRMYTSRDARRRGVARAVLDELEARARELGYRRLILETGPKQPEAIALYESRGYGPGEPFGPYADTGWTRFFAKDL
jgi:GNAT superfamily N-acetyltransferase